MFGSLLRVKPKIGAESVGVAKEVAVIADVEVVDDVVLEDVLVEAV